MSPKKKTSKGSPKPAGVNRKLGQKNQGKNTTNPKIKGGPNRPGPGVSPL